MTGAPELQSILGVSLGARAGAGFYQKDKTYL